MLRPGDWVEVRSAREIRATLDDDGALEHLPFMPEMAAHCGRRFQVGLRAERICARGAAPGEGPLRTLDGAVVLTGLRCGGESHGGCQLGCMLLWKEAWLEPVDGPGGPRRRPPRPWSPPPAAAGAVLGRSRRRWRCQATELVRATRPASPFWDPRQYLRMWWVGTLGPVELTRMYLGIVAGRLRRAWRSALRPAGLAPQASAPLRLEPGERVRVKAAGDIQASLDAAGATRGLGFSEHMYRRCGEVRTVAARVDRLIAEESGELRTIHDTVVLEGVYCERHQGCARGMPSLWREAWLERVEP